MDTDVLILGKSHEQNYNALQRLLSNEPLKRKKTSRRSHLRARSEELRDKKLLEQNGRCADCGRKFGKTVKNSQWVDETKPTFEHIIPYRFGSSIYMNGYYVCEPCNQKANNLSHKNLIKRVKKYFGSIEQPEMSA